MEDLNTSLSQYNEQLKMVTEALTTVQENTERKSLLELQSELQQLIRLTQESLDAASVQITDVNTSTTNDYLNNKEQSELDDEYALFMQEMAKSGAYETENQEKPECSTSNSQTQGSDVSDIEDELATLLGMKCAVYHTHKWGGQPSLHNAMVSAVVPRQDDDQFKDLQVRVLFTHPTHTEMLPCPFFLDGECKFDDEKCRYSHGDIVPLSSLKEAIEPNFDTIKVGSRILLKLKPPDDEDISKTKKSTEKYHLWHRAIVRHVDSEKRMCLAKLEHGVKSGEKRKPSSDEVQVHFEELFPLTVPPEQPSLRRSTANSLAFTMKALSTFGTEIKDDDDEEKKPIIEGEEDSDSDDSISDTEYPESKVMRSDEFDERSLVVEKSLQRNGPAMGEWERHTRGIGSKLMLAMGYVPGGGLGAAGEGRVQPVEARVLPQGKSLDHCMAISEKAAGMDPLKVEQKLKRLQKKEEERNKRAYEREKEKEKRNVFNFLNRTLGDNVEETPSTATSVDIKQSTSKDLNIEQFKITEDTRRLEKEVQKLNSSLARYPAGSNGHRSINLQILEKNKELDSLRNKEKLISKEQRRRIDKQKMTVF